MNMHYTHQIHREGPHHWAYEIYSPEGSACCSGRYRGTKLQAQQYVAKTVDRLRTGGAYGPWVSAGRDTSARV